MMSAITLKYSDCADALVDNQFSLINTSEKGRYSDGYDIRRSLALLSVWDMKILAVVDALHVYTQQVANIVLWRSSNKCSEAKDVALRRRA